MASFDPLCTTARDLQKLLDQGVGCFDIVEVYLRQIDLYGNRLRSVIQIASPELLRKRASELDEERRNGKHRGPLHGIPVLVKV